MRRRHVGAWNQWRRVALYQRFCNERNILLESHELAFFPEGSVRGGTQRQRGRGAIQKSRTRWPARWQRPREGLAQGARRPRGPRRIYVRGARAGASGISRRRHGRPGREASARNRGRAETERRLNARSFRKPRHETHRATLKSAQSTYEAAVKAALADKDRARLLQAQKQALQRVLRVLRRWLRESCWLLCLVAASGDPFLEGQDLTAVRLLERTVARIGRRHVGFSFACWLRAVKREKRRQAALRAFDRSLRRWSRSSVAASLSGRVWRHASRVTAAPRLAVEASCSCPKQDHLFSGSVWCSMRAQAHGRLLHAANLFSHASTARA